MKRSVVMSVFVMLVCAVPVVEAQLMPADGPGTKAPPLEANKLYLRLGTIDTGGIVDLRIDSPAWFDPQTIYVAQLDGPMTPQRRAALVESGVMIGGYLPQHAYTVDLAQVTPADLNGLDFVRWVGVYQNEWKIDPGIGHRLAPFQAQERIDLAGLGRLKLVVVLAAGWDVQEAQVSLAALGAEIIDGHVVGGQGEIDLIIDQGLLGLLAQEPGVRYIEEAPEVTLRNSTDRWIVQSNVTNSTPLYDNGLTGVGQIVGILDGQVDANHCSFSDTEPIGLTHRKIVAYNSPLGSHYHGTHVAGTVVGDAGAFDNGRGVAYEGRLAYNTVPSYNETAIVDRLTTHHNQGARIHTNSWGNDATTAYDSLARGFDVFSHDYEDDLVLLAVTNLSSLKNPENAKNLLAVGASQDTPSQDLHCSGGIGPTSDGRRKPEIYAPGCNTFSSRFSTGCDTWGMTGTSMACPAVAGTGMLVRQYYTDGYYPSGTPTLGDEVTPSGALIKATLLNSAVDMTGIAGYPSDQEGWGRVLADNALYFPGDNRKQVVLDDVRNADGLSTGNTQEYPLAVQGSAEQLRITLVWTDAPALAGAGFAAVNDLDLEVVSPSATLYLGNVFSGGVSVPGGSKDDRNNVEQVHVDASETGVWTVRVIGAGVNQGPQGYALLATGEVALGQPPSIVGVRSLADHGPGGVLGLDLGGSDVEPRLAGVAMIEVTFDLAMDASTAQDGNNVAISGVNNPSPGVTASPVLDGSGTVLTITLSAALADRDCYTIDLAGMTAGGIPLDPAASFFSVSALRGDIDRNGTVATTDFSVVKPHFGETAAPGNAEFDYDCSGVVATTDASLVKPLFGNSAPLCP